MLLYNFLNLVINGDQLWTVELAIAREKESRAFNTAALVCVVHTVHWCADEIVVCDVFDSV